MTLPDVASVAERAANAKERAARTAEEAAEARALLQELEDVASAERARRNIALRKERLAAYNAEPLGDEVRRKEAAFRAALEEDPVTVAWIELLAARLRYKGLHREAIGDAGLIGEGQAEHGPALVSPVADGTFELELAKTVAGIAKERVRAEMAERARVLQEATEAGLT